MSGRHLKVGPMARAGCRVEKKLSAKGWQNERNAGRVTTEWRNLNGSETKG